MAPKTTIAKARFNIILQGKGGVGKSFISALLAQYLQSKGEPTISIDTDPNNTTLYSIKALKAKFLKLINEDDKLDEQSFDKLMELAFSNVDHNFVVDNGATSFLPLISYININDVFTMLSEHFDVIIHVPITGGQSQEDTLNGLQTLIDDYSNKVKFIVWINEFQGKIRDSEGNSFENMPIYIKNKNHILAFMYLEKQHEQLTGRDLEQMTKAKLTFNEIDTNPDFGLMTKQRLKLYQKDIFQRLDTCFKVANNG